MQWLVSEWEREHEVSTIPLSLIISGTTHNTPGLIMEGNVRDRVLRHFSNTDDLLGLEPQAYKVCRLGRKNWPASLRDANEAALHDAFGASSVTADGIDYQAYAAKVGRLAGTTAYVDLAIAQAQFIAYELARLFTFEPWTRRRRSMTGRQPDTGAPIYAEATETVQLHLARVRPFGGQAAGLPEYQHRASFVAHAGTLQNGDDLNHSTKGHYNVLLVVGAGVYEMADAEAV